MDESKNFLSSVQINTAWHLRFVQQFYALFWKNVLLAWRNWKTTLVRLFAPFIFLLLVWLIDKALQANERALEETKVRRHPKAEYVTDIPRCEEDLYIRGDCKSFLYSVEATGDVTEEQANRTIAEIVSFIRTANNPQIAEHKVVYFEDRQEINEWFLRNPERALGAIHFEVSNDEKWIDFTLQTNSTPKYFKNEFQDPNFFFQIPLQNAVQRAIAVHQLRRENKIGAEDVVDWSVAYKDYPHPAFNTESVAGALLGPFLFAANMFGVVTQTNAMVSEKEGGLKQALRTMGMLDSAYWSSWAAWEISLNFFTSLLNIAFGCIFQFKFFLDNSFALVFLLLFLFQLSMVVVGFALSSLINKVVVATVLGFVIFVLGWMTFTVQQFGIPYTSEYFDRLMYLTVIFTALAWNVFMKGVDDLGSATSNEENNGLSFSQRFSYCKDEDDSDECVNLAAASDEFIDCECVLALGHLYWILLVLFLGYVLLAVYIEKVIPNEFGVRLHPLYFVDPRYWGFKTELKPKHVFKMLNAPQVDGTEMDADVAREVERMKEFIDETSHQSIPTGRPVELFGLQKRFGWRDPFFAIRGNWFSIDEGELFCLLGPNGAGKTTTINCLTGVLPPSGGDSFLYNHSISEPGGMDRIRAMMGVCPQFDVLWKSLSGFEHLWIFGLVKGIPFKAVTEESRALLEKVALSHADIQKVGTYSGGMKRRLSVAIALLGDPKIVFLDEPTTGMDPISRRYVWDIIESAKAGRAIVLTTHSMEEADILGDRICIMARGDVRALGTSIRLKQRFGAGYAISVSVQNGSRSQLNEEKTAARVKQFFQEALGLQPTEENKAYITFLIPREKESTLPDFLQELERTQEELGITDINLSLTTLEEVFLNIARAAEIEALRAVGVSTMSVPFTDGTRVSIMIGQDQFVHPATNVTYQLHWGQTDSGSLQITDAIPMGDVPEGAPDPNLSQL